MIVPSIDISGGQAVQLVSGETVAVEAGDPRPLMDRFSIVGEVAVVDIDAARGEGDNAELIAELCAMGRVRVGGGIRKLETANRWLDAGADKIVLGTAATPELLQQLPAERVIVALDARNGKVVTHGWRTQTDRDPVDQIGRLQGLCGGFLVTFVEREGGLAGTDLVRARQVVAAARGAHVTIAGGITTAEEIRTLDRMDADAQIGMALYTGRLSLSEAFAAPLTTDRADGLWPTVVVDGSGHALGLTYSDEKTLTETIETRRGVYHSRKRGRWVKGESSANVQQIRAIDIDCDRDTLRFTVDQERAFCHTGTRTCWGDDRGLNRLDRRLGTIATESIAGNTSRLVEDPALLAAKLREEAGELAVETDQVRVIEEAADLLFFTLVKAVSAGVSLSDIEAELDRRERRVTRRDIRAKESH